MGSMCFDYPLVFTLGNVLPAEKAFIGQSPDIFGNLNDVNVFPKFLKLPTDSFRLILKKHFLQSSFWYCNVQLHWFLFKVSNGNTRTMCEICTRLTITPEWRHWGRSGVSIVNFEQILHIIVVFSLLTLHKQMPAGEVFSIYIFRTWISIFFQVSWSLMISQGFFMITFEAFQSASSLKIFCNQLFF